jgi:hypothetical protein
MNDDDRAPNERTHNVFWILDGGHGWLAVSLDTYPDALEHATGYGYARPGWIYLEEDGEAGKFLRTRPSLLEASRNGLLARRIYSGDWPGRAYDHNTPPALESSSR